MSAVVEKALWLIEHRYGQELTLEAMAEHIGVSRFYLSRSFPAATGMSISAYLRGRRLTEAAKALAAGAPDILSVALEATYGSHEAFTRAFRDQFGLTPERVRGQGCVSKLELVEPITLDDLTTLKLADPVYVDHGPLLLVGLLESYRDGDMSAIPNQWQRFAPWLGNIPHQVPNVTHGVVFNGDDEGTTDYLTAVEVSDFSDVPAPLSRLRLGAQRYAVWRHAGHISEIRAVWRTIWADWAQTRVKTLADAPFFERYPESFDPMSGEGGFEIWLPVGG